MYKEQETIEMLLNSKPNDWKIYEPNKKVKHVDSDIWVWFYKGAIRLLRRMGTSALNQQLVVEDEYNMLIHKLTGKKLDVECVGCIDKFIEENEEIYSKLIVKIPKTENDKKKMRYIVYGKQKKYVINTIFQPQNTKLLAIKIKLFLI